MTVSGPNTNYWGFGGGQEGSHWDVTSQQEKKFEQSIVEKGMKRVSDIITYKVILKSNDKEEELQRFGNPFMTRVIIRSIGLHYEGRQD
ncbi:hypothetical protein [Paenibacillus pseudetheri]|uniref:Uncharacterized protein n=1 Tax=Paenibacillus pseudetheri TaxID=2897682 RepID=A0ABM9BFK1_9BACL|nr:hypothetical protein [Paenibacillus pseudetheri]CAH1057319.1 hypothetical protein PAECIP111894_03477 [Paenibacillus pseudetheri]